MIFSIGKRVLIDRTPILLIFAIGAFLRFHNLMWGAPYFFHPDERNMATSISQVAPPLFHPHFFAYGQFPLYLSYFSFQLINLLIATFSHKVFVFSPVPFDQAIFWLRFYSALSGSLAIIVFYLISRKFFDKKLSLLSTLCLSFLPGLIQSSHFGTTESILTFLFLLVIFFVLSLFDRFSLKKLLLISLFLGVSLATKVSAVVFFAVPFSFLLYFLRSNFSFKGILLFLTLIFFVVFFSLIFFFLFSPYNLFDFGEFTRITFYESMVARGGIPVFYVRQFTNTLPVIFQFYKIFPYTCGLFIVLFSIPGLILAFFRLEKKLFLVVFSFLVYFLLNAFLFAKWTRFVTPVFPLVALFAFYFVSCLKNRRLFFLSALSLLTFSTVIYGISFFSIYQREDVRVSASRWIYNNIPDSSRILSETANVIDIPVHVGGGVVQRNYNITSFDFYGVDENKELFEKLVEEVYKSDYIFVPSRRIFSNHMRVTNRFPVLLKYYEALFSGALGFDRIVEIDSFPSFGPFRSSDEMAEETWTVFDHPVVRIYKKTVHYPEDYYRRLLTVN